MPSSYNGRGGGGPKKFDGKITEKVRVHGSLII
jgi:hypothetical protein